MSDELLIRVNMTNGTARALWTDDLPLLALGKCAVTRASNVEFDNAKQAWYYATPDGKVIADGFRSRTDALAAERTWANSTL